ncbi:ATPase [Porphyromonas canoris]|uniref:AAA family ATPase n=1 Tax=Porphyromonas canoris TaxID=36875 RepID=UPI00051D0B0D|nr:AAA family ATPase [Porphyromonas canoris]KGL50853.1 ATPase [Porphyromonas canoris]
MENIYKRALLDNVRTISKAYNTGGKLEDCVVRVLNNDDKAANILLSIVSKVETSNDTELISLTKELFSNLINYYGFERIIKIKEINANPDIQEKTFEELKEELNELIGLKTVKEKVNDLISYQQVQTLRKKQGLKQPSSTMHLAFMGNPGTGKTTVARLIGQLYKHLGLLSRGHFVEVSRTDLIAGYQGQTALKVKNVIDQAKGGVLFIDEAYSITENDHSDSYGRECLTELTKALEDYRNDLIVIVAGYTDPMKKFFDSNPGLRSRFNTFIEFEDYKQDELSEIFKQLCSKGDYKISSEGLAKLEGIFTNELSKENCLFANGRFVRNVYENAIIKHARRVAKMESPTINDLCFILEQDIIET